MIADPFTITDGHGVTIGGVIRSERNGGSWATRCERCERVTRVGGYQSATDALVALAQHIAREHTT